MDDKNSKGFLGSLFDFSFKHYVTGKIIRVLYIISMILVGIGTLIFLAGAVAENGTGGIIVMLILAPIGFLLFLTYARVTLELIMVLFNISEGVSEISRATEQMSAAVAGALRQQPGGGQFPPGSPPAPAAGIPPAGVQPHGTPPPGTPHAPPAPPAGTPPAGTPPAGTPPAGGPPAGGGAVPPPPPPPPPPPGPDSGGNG